MELRLFVKFPVSPNFMKNYLFCYDLGFSFSYEKNKTEKN